MNISQGQHKGKCCDCTYPRLTHQQTHTWILFSHSRHCIVEALELNPAETRFHRDAGRLRAIASTRCCIKSDCDNRCSEATART